MGAAALVGAAAAAPVAEVGVPARPAARARPLDEAEFLALYAAVARPLRAYLAAASGSRGAADDLLQETFLRFVRSGFSGADETENRRYLYRIATNLVRDRHRQRRPETEELGEVASDDRLAETVELRRDVGGALVRLSRRDRELLWLAYVEGSSHDEIAGALGLRSASIRSMLFRARQRMAAKLARTGFGPATGKETTS
jgi:RNA polymerase sigma-70 factor, ECF subfamily